ncbi:MAG: HAD-IIB family hydrolase [Patescibacteria group bacterium]|nr:HAD-IIB family hydrolase [Patescibacteria group bacterium]MCL5224266.1 HAD-IIB family hydrolase [Patescibacteria group bacterium]
MATLTKKSITGKRLIVFDLDGTLTETKSNLKADMSKALDRLLAKKKVAVIGGSGYKQWQSQFISELGTSPQLLSNLFLFPTTATSFYRYNKGWKKIYAYKLSIKERQQIKNAFRAVLRDIRYVPPKRTYGKVIENRGTQITFSALGQDVVARLGEKGVRLKKEWTKKNTPLKLKIVRLMQQRLPRMEVHAAGFTSIDVTRKGIDKAYGIRQIVRYLHVPIEDMLFVGDALFPGGNDYAARRTGVRCIAVKGPAETKRIIKEIVG